MLTVHIIFDNSYRSAVITMSEIPMIHQCISILSYMANKIVSFK